ncbi:MAG: NAD(P)-dependent oxidoreductase [Tepidisphaeraceae bacterium]|jgi:3-hydroxyisobutyrate dehydrogenase
MDTRLGFIGLGIMGAPMAGRLMDARYTLAVHSRTKSKASRLIARGARFLDSPAAVAAESNVVFICVTDTRDVEAVVRGDDGIAASARRGLIVVDHSTISPTATRQLADELAKQGAHFIDAPVSGGDVGARNGTLSIMAGGDPVAFERVEPMLRILGSTITYCGPSGTGQLTKLVNQILVSVTNLAVCEALTFAKENGLNLEKTIAALSAGAAGSWQLANLGPRMIAGDFRPGFTISLQQKDLRLILQSACESNISLPAASLAHQLFTAAQAAGHGKDGTQALFTVVEKLASLH